MSEKGEDFSRIVANLTHELKTPLHSILAVASLLQSQVDGVLSEDQKRQVDIIVRNGEHLLELISGLLLFTSTTTESRTLNVRRLNVLELFSDLVRSVEPLARKAGVKLESDLTKLSPLFYSDKTLLYRIVSNLLGNAVKFSPNGGSVSLFAETLQDGSLRIQVADTGIGMDAELQQTIFQAFFQGDRGDSKRFQGVGLGLSLVKAALDLLEGEISVKSEPQQGSLFTLLIPSAELKAHRRLILIFEEDPGVRLGLSESFASQGYECILLQADESPLRAIAEGKPDLVLLDAKPPHYIGFAVLEQVRRESWGRDLPIIIMSTLDAREDRGRAFSLGASDFIVKPFDLVELLARVRSQLERPW